MSGWTVDTLHAYMMALLLERSARVDMRFDAVHALASESDRRYEQRWVSQEKAVHDALASQEKAVAAALQAAATAVAKAENASEKRFESVNEFRGQLNDQAARLMPRSESEARFTAVTEKLSEQSTASRDQIDRIRHEMATTRDEQMRATQGLRDEQLKAIVSLRDELQKGVAILTQTQNLATGKGAGVTAAYGYAVGAAGLVLAIGAFIINLTR